jgi:hypothetical protein
MNRKCVPPMLRALKCSFPADRLKSTSVWGWAVRNVTCEVDFELHTVAAWQLTTDAWNAALTVDPHDDTNSESDDGNDDNNHAPTWFLKGSGFCVPSFNEYEG